MNNKDETHGKSTDAVERRDLPPTSHIAHPDTLPGYRAGVEVTISRLTVLLGVVLAAYAALHRWRVLHTTSSPELGEDLHPLHDAAVALAHGTSLYNDRLFAYSPPAAVLLFPIRSLTPARIYHAVLFTEIAALLVAVCMTYLLVSSVRRSRLRVLIVGVTFALLITGPAFARTLFYGNIDAFLPATFLGWVLLVRRQNQLPGLVLLAVSCLIKPILAPLFLLPLLAGRVRPTVIAALATIAAFAVSFVVFDGARDDVSGMLSNSGRGVSGTVGDLSIHGFGVVHHMGSLADVLRLLIGASGLWLVARRSRHDPDSLDTLAAATALMATAFVVGPFAEIHYVPAVVPAAICIAAASRSALARALSVAVLVSVVLPDSWLPTNATHGAADQLRWLITLIVALLACAMHLQQAWRREPAAPHLAGQRCTFRAKVNARLHHSSTHRSLT